MQLFECINSVRLQFTSAEPCRCRVELSSLSFEQNESFKRQDQSLQDLITSFTKSAISLDHLARLMSNESNSTRELITQSSSGRRRKQKRKRERRICVGVSWRAFISLRFLAGRKKSKMLTRRLSNGYLTDPGKGFDLGLISSTGSKKALERIGSMVKPALENRR